MHAGKSGESTPAATKGRRRLGHRLTLWSDRGRTDHPGATRHPSSARRGIEVLSPAYRERTIIVWILWATAYFVTNSLNNWMPSLYNTVYRLDLQQALRAASMTNVAQVLVLLDCAFCIDRIGRRKWTTA